MTLEDRLPDQFSRDLLAGSLLVANEDGNPVRLHLAAAGLRELFGHVLHKDAPDEEVRACAWFVQDPNTPTVTRRQKAIYSTQGGLSDAYVEGLGLDVGELHATAIKSIQALNRATHVQPETVINDHAVIDTFIKKVLAALEGLLESFQEGRDTVKEALVDDVYQAMWETLVQQTFDEIDILAGKGYEVDPWIDDQQIEVEAIRSNVVVVRFSGIADVTLHYGPKNDTAAIPHDFPFWMRFEAPVDNPTKLALTAYHIDDTDWYT